MFEGFCSCRLLMLLMLQLHAAAAAAANSSGGGGGGSSTQQHAAASSSSCKSNICTHMDAASRMATRTHESKPSKDCEPKSVRNQKKKGKLAGPFECRKIQQETALACAWCHTLDDWSQDCCLPVATCKNLQHTTEIVFKIHNQYLVAFYWLLVGGGCPK